MPYVRTVKTAAGATAVQIVYCSRRRARDIEHIGSGTANPRPSYSRRQRIAVGQGELDLGLDDRSSAGGSLEITSSRPGPFGTRCAGV